MVIGLQQTKNQMAVLHISWIDSLQIPFTEKIVPTLKITLKRTNPHIWRRILVQQNHDLNWHFFFGQRHITNKNTDFWWCNAPYYLEDKTLASKLL